MLTRADISREIAPIYNEEMKIADIPMVFHEIETNGIGYLDLMFDLSDVPEKDLPMVFISHDLKSVKSISDRILVMYQGRIVEELKKEDGFRYEHLYTARLLESLPIDHPSKRESLVHNFEDEVLTAV